MPYNRPARPPLRDDDMNHPLAERVSRKGNPMSYVDIAYDVITSVSKVERAKLTPEMELVADLGLDSARALELLVELEERLEAEIDDEEAASLNTVGDIIEYVKKLEAAN